MSLRVFVERMSFLLGTISNPALKEFETVVVNTELPTEENPVAESIPEDLQSDLR